MNPLFLSLGSEYTSEILEGQTAAWQMCDSQQIKEKLSTALLSFFPEHRTHAYTVQGRDSIELALRALGVGSGDEVLTQAFSCHAVPAAIERTGATPVFVDISTETLNPSLETLSEALQRAPRARALIIQHTLGLPADSIALRQWCTKHHLFLLEDLAQGFGGIAADGSYLGTQADAIVLSFGKNKVLDATGGGACLLKPMKVCAPGVLAPYSQLTPILPSFFQRSYPLATSLARKAWQWGIGAPFVKALKVTGFISSPVADAAARSRQCPVLLAAWALVQVEHLAKQLAHRRSIAALYAAPFATKLVGTPDQYQRGSCLRVVVRTNSPENFIAAAKSHHMFLADRWYREPVDSGSLHYAHSYVFGQCPHAEELARTTVNLPTHWFVTERDVVRISAVAKKVGI